MCSLDGVAESDGWVCVERGGDPGVREYTPFLYNQSINYAINQRKINKKRIEKKTILSKKSFKNIFSFNNLAKSVGGGVEWGNKFVSS